MFLAEFRTSAAGYKLADKVGKDIADFRDEILDVRKSVDNTMAALDKIVVTASIDPRKAFKEFDKSVPDVDAAAKKAKKRSDSMRERGKEYFDKWEKDLASVNDPEIRKLAEERKARLQSTFTNIKNTMDPARDQFDAWLANLKDLQKYLSQDLTISGIDEAKELIAKSKEEGVVVQLALDTTIVELNSVVAVITPARTFPRFPWPPPEASATANLPSEFFPKARRLRDIDAKLSKPLESCEYAQTSYYAVPDGFGLVTRIEQINEDGSSKPTPGRWATNIVRSMNFSVDNYIRALFQANPGRFRVIVFVVSEHAFTQSDVEVTRQQGTEWVRDGFNRLPKAIGDLQFTPDHICTALIYEFELPETKDRAVLRKPSHLSCNTHLSKARIWLHLSR